MAKIIQETLEEETKEYLGSMETFQPRSMQAPQIAKANIIIIINPPSPSGATPLRAIIPSPTVLINQDSKDVSIPQLQ